MSTHKAVTNLHNVPLALAVWLLADDYDYVNEPNYISATTLLKPLRHIILPRRVPHEMRVAADVSDFLARRMGQSLHNSIEHAWINKYAQSLKLLGYPDHVIKNVVINPTPEALQENKEIIPIYLERRDMKKIGKWLIGGKFDLVAEGRVMDFKSTSTYVWTRGVRDDEHILQGSIYRLIHPEIITEDTMEIAYIFKDWSKALALNNPAYPQRPMLSKSLDLMSLEDTENWIKRKLALVEQFWDAPEKDIPECTNEELWLGEPKFKYYGDPEKAKDPNARSTKNFDSLSEANKYKAEKGKGIVITAFGSPKRCKEYCDAFPICTQKDRYQHD